MPLLCVPWMPRLRALDDLSLWVTHALYRRIRFLQLIESRSDPNKMFCVSLAVHAGITHTMFRKKGSRIGDSAGPIHVCCSERFNQLSARDGLTDAAYCLCLGMHRRSLPRHSQFPQSHSSHFRNTPLPSAMPGNKQCERR